MQQALFSIPADKHTEDYITVRLELAKEVMQCAFDLMMISKYLERIGDHTTNIAEWVEFSITGVHVE